ncbi:MAG TPA: hypothetical protein VKP69_14395 [Isosphaeraceae bacterium]|nr:hypothetical protein [Isosphaeraceae bacterium]
MPFYVGGTKLDTKSDINQGANGNCYIVAPVAAYNLCRTPRIELQTVVASVGPGMGGSSDRAFRAMNLYAFSKSSGYSDSWKRLIKKAVDRSFPVCLGISWRNLDKKGGGNHVIYVTGYENDTVYARDQQNNHVLISVDMKDPWESTEFVAGTKTSRECTVSWVGFGCPTKLDAQNLLAE